MLGGYGNPYGVYYGSPNCKGNGKHKKCDAKSRWHAYGLDWCDPCGPVGTAARWKVPGAKCICHCCNTKAFPDSGWAPPARVPVNYTSRGFASWYGNSGPFTHGAPMVYQPTDTAQLGFSYGHVPTWKKDPSRIPSVPRPSQFHNRSCPGRPGSGGCPTIPIYSSHVQGATCPTCVTGAVMMPQPMLVAQPAPPKLKAATTARIIRQTSSSPAMQPVRNAAATRPTHRPRQSSSQKMPSRSGGWFGLPSLSEMTF